MWSLPDFVILTCRFGRVQAGVSKSREIHKSQKVSSGESGEVWIKNQPPRLPIRSSSEPTPCLAGFAPLQLRESDAGRLLSSPAGILHGSLPKESLCGYGPMEEEKFVLHILFIHKLPKLHYNFPSFSSKEGWLSPQRLLNLL